MAGSSLALKRHVCAAHCLWRGRWTDIADARVFVGDCERCQTHRVEVVPLPGSDAPRVLALTRVDGTGDVWIR